MAKHFKKKCTCHGKVFLVNKVAWKTSKRIGTKPYCREEVFKAGYVYIPYIPLQTVEIA